MAAEQATLNAGTSTVEAQQRATAVEEKLVKTELQLGKMRKVASDARRDTNTEGRAFLALKARSLCRALTRRDQRDRRLSEALLSMRRNAASAARQQVRVQIRELASRGNKKEPRQTPGEGIRLGLVVKLWSACSVIQRLIEVPGNALVGGDLTLRCCCVTPE